MNTVLTITPHEPHRGGLHKSERMIVKGAPKDSQKYWNLLINTFDKQENCECLKWINLPLPIIK